MDNKLNLKKRLRILKGEIKSGNIKNTRIDKEIKNITKKLTKKQ